MDLESRMDSVRQAIRRKPARPVANFVTRVNAEGCNPRTVHRGPMTVVITFCVDFFLSHSAGNKKCPSWRPVNLELNR